jgi:glycine amidinotransferase
VSQASVVSSWNEWDPLRHVIVGVADHAHIPDREPGLMAKIPEESDLRGRAGPRSQDTVHRANALLDGLANRLVELGVQVDRPTPMDFSRPIQTPDFTVPHQMGCMPPRDVLLTVGSEIVEATMSYRCRWFEYLCYRPLLQRYFEEDADFRLEAAPKPRLTAASFRSGYLADEIDVATRLAWTAKRSFVTTEEEILFDAADVTRCGRDLFVQHGFTTNLKGIDWLRRHFPRHRVHTLHFPGDPYPIHIDCTFVPIRPGLILANPLRSVGPDWLDFFARNDWRIVPAAPPAHKTPPPLCYSSVWLSMNVLVLDPKTVLVEETEVNQADQLDRLGMNVIPIPLRDAYPFGGGLHCCTADVRREGGLEDYFPHAGGYAP